MLTPHPHEDWSHLFSAPEAVGPPMVGLRVVVDNTTGVVHDPCWNPEIGLNTDEDGDW